MFVTDHPGCWGAAARLPKNPGSQKLTPPSSAKALRGAETMVASASTAIAAIGRIDRAQSNPILLASETVLPFIIAPKVHQPVDSLMVFRTALWPWLWTVETVSMSAHTNRTIVTERTRRQPTDVSW